MENLLHSLRNELKSRSTEQNRIAGERFFKEEVRLYGVKAPQVQAIAREFYNKQVKHLSKNDVLNLCERLWQSGYLEETFVACHWTEKLVKQFTPDDFSVLEQWVERYISNWASCDTFCNHTVGDMLMRYPHLTENLKNWTKSENRWVRRASAVSFIVPARKGLFQNQIIQIAELLLTDTDDMVQKGYGWMLKAASQADQKLVFDFVMKYKAKMPRTALRYAIEKMPSELREQALAK